MGWISITINVSTLYNLERIFYFWLKSIFRYLSIGNSSVLCWGLLWSCGQDLAWAADTWWFNGAGRSMSKRLAPMAVGWRAHFLTSCVQSTCGSSYRSALQGIWWNPKQVIQERAGAKGSRKPQGLLGASLCSCTVPRTLYLSVRHQLLSLVNTNGETHTQN